MTTLRYEAPDGRVVTATSGGVICVWADGSTVGDIDSIVVGPHSIPLPQDRPRTIDQLAIWYRDLRMIDLQSHHDVLAENEQRSRRQLEIAAEAYAADAQKLRDFVQANRL